jgi:integrase
MKFTQANVTAFQSPPGKADHFEWDEALPGFGIRVQNGGRKSYVAQYKIGTRQRRLSLGKVEKVKFSAAQKEAKSIFELVAKKIDPATERAKAVAEAGQTFNPAIDGFLAKLKEERAESYHAATKKYLEEHFKALHKLPLTSIDRAMAAKELNTIKEERGPIAMNRARSAGSAFFNWVIREGLCETNPFDKTNKNGETHRERTLTPRELKVIWNGVPDDEFGDIVKLFILTMQRRDEIGGLPTSEFNREKRQLEIKGARFKNGKDNTIPLSDAAFDILQKRYDKEREFIFGRYDTGFSGWSKAKAELDEVLGINDSWVFHDFRRTGKTVMEEELDVPDAVSESILNHAKKGLNKVYNTATYIAKKRDALDQYAAYILSAVA